MPLSIAQEARCTIVQGPAHQGVPSRGKAQHLMNLNQLERNLKEERTDDSHSIDDDRRPRDERHHLAQHAPLRLRENASLRALGPAVGAPAHHGGAMALKGLFRSAPALPALYERV